MSPQARPAQRKRVLNVGSGHYHPTKLHPAFNPAEWTEVRLDIDPDVSPDVVGTVTDMRGFAPDASYDAIWSSHNVEHLHSFEVDAAFREFRRVLKPTGFALITCPDLEAVARMIIDGRIQTVAYTAPAGPITPLDMLFGHSASIAAGSTFMAHNTGYTAERLGRVALDAGFSEVRVGRGRCYDLWAIALMPEVGAADLQALFRGTDELALLQ